MTVRFSEESAPNKRALSRYEKQFIKNTSEYAVIFPGGVGDENNPKEYEELLEIGFDKSKIFCFEESNAKRFEISFFYEESTVYGSIEKDYINLSNNSVSYGHLDFMASIKKNVFLESAGILDKFVDQSILRITTTQHWGKAITKSKSVLFVKNLLYFYFLPQCSIYGVNQFKINKVKKIVDSYFSNIKYKSFISAGDVSKLNGNDGIYGDIGIAMFLYHSLVLSDRDCNDYSDIDFVLQDYATILNCDFNAFDFDSNFKFIYGDGHYGMLTSQFLLKKQYTNPVKCLNSICDYIIMDKTLYDSNNNS